MPAGSPCVEPHVDEWELSQLPLHKKRHPDIVAIIYLSEAPPGTGRFTFSFTNLKVPPMPGSMLTFAIEQEERADGTWGASNASMHWVEELPADAADRILIQVSIDLDGAESPLAGGGHKDVVPASGRSGAKKQVAPQDSMNKFLDKGLPDVNAPTAVKRAFKANEGDLNRGKGFNPKLVRVKALNSESSDVKAEGLNVLKAVGESAPAEPSYYDPTACSGCYCDTSARQLRRLLFGSTTACDKCCALLAEQMPGLGAVKILPAIPKSTTKIAKTAEVEAKEE